MKKRLLIRWGIPVVIVELLVLVIVPQWGSYITCAWGGFVAGAILHYHFGRKDEERMIEKHYGESWRIGAVRQMMDERRQKAPMN